MGVAKQPRRYWHVLPKATPEQSRGIGSYSPLIAQLLLNRGLTNPGEAKNFLQGVDGPSPDPFLLPNADAAVSRLARAVQAGERIAIFGDFDADGVTASAVLTEGLRGIDAKVIPYIPDRVSEGHGLNLPAVQYLKNDGVTLIVTAVCGISSAGEVSAAAELAMDTIVTDHHAPPEYLPEAVALVNPKLKGAPPLYADLASVGVAAVLMDALYSRLGRPPDESLLEFVALGTVADIAPLGGAVNRRLVRRGLGQINRTARPGMRELLKAARVQPGQCDVEAIAYGLGPRINAPGRVDHANAAYQLLIARSAAEAQPLAAELELRNTERQRLTRDILERVRSAIPDPLPPIIFLADPEYSAGVVGLAAGKLTETYNRPAVVCQIGAEETRGSCRSIPEFNIVEALRGCKDLFLRYGGHAQAAGFTVRTRDLSELKARLTAIAAAALDGQQLTRRIVIDAETPLESINGQIIRALSEFAPHGPQNPAPVFLSRTVEVKDFRPMGEQGRHTRMRLKAGPVTWNAVAFDSELGPAPPAPMVDLVYTLSVDRWNGQNTLQMRVLDMAPS